MGPVNVAAVGRFLCGPFSSNFVPYVFGMFDLSVDVILCRTLQRPILDENHAFTSLVCFYVRWVHRRACCRRFQDAYLFKVAQQPQQRQICAWWTEYGQ